jgi:hypothetical protein
MMCVGSSQERRLSHQSQKTTLIMVLVMALLRLMELSTQTIATALGFPDLLLCPSMGLIQTFGLFTEVKQPQKVCRTLSVQALTLFLTTLRAKRAMSIFLKMMTISTF